MGLNTAIATKQSVKIMNKMAEKKDDQKPMVIDNLFMLYS
jgi:hypothetical protein